MTTNHAQPNEDRLYDDNDFARWREAFRTHRRLVQLGITARKPRPERMATLKQAKLAVPDLQTDDDSDLEIIANGLEAKLSEMVGIIRGTARGKLIYTARPPTFDTETLPGDLLEDYWRDERRWLFTCGALELLHDYRDHGRHLLLKMRQDLLKTLASGVSQVSETIDALNSHLLVEACLDASEHEEIANATETIRNAHTLYNERLSSAGAQGLTGVMDSNWYRVRNQYTVTGTLLALRIYGHITTDALERLLTLKTVSYLDRSTDSYALAEVTEAERKHNERNRARAVTAIMQSARRANWPILSVLQLYRHNQRYGRRSAIENLHGNS